MRFSPLYLIASLICALSLTAFSSASSATSATSCPSFSCSSPNQCSATQPGGLTATGPGKFASVTINSDGSHVTAPSDCCASCLSFAPTCAYWTYATSSSGAGVCYLYTAAICDPNNGYQYTPCAIAAMNFTGTNETTGYICPSVLSPPPPSPPAPVGIVGDPHYTGADGSRFDFTGEPNKTYCAFSDAHVHVNVLHGGRYGQWGGSVKPLTWMRQVAVLWGHHSVVFEARAGAQWQYGNGYVAGIRVDGESLMLKAAGDQKSLFGDRVTVRWVAAKEVNGDDLTDVYEVKIVGAMRLTLRARPEIEMFRTAEDGVVHFGLEVSDSSFSPRVHGVLGQTFRADHASRLSHQTLAHSDLLEAWVVPGDNAEGFIDGSPGDYETSSLLSADCTFSRFARAEAMDAETAEAIESSKRGSITSKLPSKVMATSRKLLQV